MLALDNEYAARLHPFAQRADLGPGIGDIYSVYKEIGSVRWLLGKLESKDHLCPSNAAFIQCSSIHFA